MEIEGLSIEVTERKGPLVEGAILEALEYGKKIADAYLVTNTSDNKDIHISKKSGAFERSTFPDSDIA